MLSLGVDKVTKTPLKVFNTISPIQMYQRKTVEHLPLGCCLLEASTTIFIVWLQVEMRRVGVEQVNRKTLS